MPLYLYAPDWILFCFSLQDVCIPDLIKLLDILGDNGVIHMEFNTLTYDAKTGTLFFN